MPEVVLDDRGRLTIPEDLRDRYGDRYRVVGRHDAIELIPLADDPLDALRDEFSDVENSSGELRDDARATSLDESGH